ncbi:quinone oxidoreductase family protein [Azospirillum brasilense]|uniref:quinone oxidoreductase family protein n=1 Tax=Azospirillum brasilense TaxID=192 RepID=UPI0003A5E3BC|nr:quinone oxidoreductase [Azospirillum brasilense]
MVHAIRIHDYGGPEALRWEEIEVGDPGPGQVRLRQTAVGLNYIDTYHRSGAYKLPQLPAIIGTEGAGVVEAVGPDVTTLKPGDRVGYAPLIGAYAESRLAPADRLIPLPSWIEDRQAAAMLLQGMTAQFLLRSTYAVQPGDTILVQAAAGGVGQMLCQWAHALGATVIGTVGSPEKAAVAQGAGCDHVILYHEEDFAARVRDITGGRGVDVVYDSVGQDTFMASLDCLKPFSLMVSFGQASGPVAPLDISVLAQKGSIFLAKPTLATVTRSRDDIEALAGGLFEALASGRVQVGIAHRAPLTEAASVHRDLEARRTTGPIVLIP